MLIHSLKQAKNAHNRQIFRCHTYGNAVFERYYVELYSHCDTEHKFVVCFPLPHSSLPFPFENWTVIYSEPNPIISAACHNNTKDYRLSSMLLLKALLYEFLFNKNYTQTFTCDMLTLSLNGWPVRKRQATNAGERVCFVAWNEQNCDAKHFSGSNLLLKCW